MKTGKLIPGTMLMLAVLFFSSCGKKDSGVTPNPPGPVNPEQATEYKSSYAYNLNIVYFVASDRDTNAFYHQRLSKIFIESQHLVTKWMKYWGFGDLTYGILKDERKGLVKIHLVRGKLASDAYKDGMDANIKKEVDEYFTANPGLKTSEHVFIISAVQEKLDQGELLKNSVPFYGTGKYAYALDYPGMKQESLGTGGMVGEKATVYIGGLLHEMGHGINLPHNGPTKSQSADPAFGMTLMGSGNYTYGKSPTFISKFDCAILASGQLTAKTYKTFYEPVTTTITNLAASYSGDNILVSGKFTSTGTVSNIAFYHIPEDNAQGYTALTWTIAPAADNSFSISMPVSDFHSKGNFNYELRIYFMHTNGQLTSQSYAYKFVNNVPVIDFGDKPLLPRAAWSIVSASSAQSGYPASHVLDGLTNTYWHTSWSDLVVNHPHTLVIQTGTAVNAAGFCLRPRPDAGEAGKIKQFTIEISNDGIVWTKVIENTMSIASGNQYFPMNETKTFKYFRITSLSDYKNERFASLSEVNLY